MKTLEICFKKFSYCPDNPKFKIKGRNYSFDAKTFSINISKCKNGTSIICQSDADIEDYVNHINIFFTFGVKYYDSSDYENPIKNTIDDRFFFSLDPDVK